MCNFVSKEAVDELLPDKQDSPELGLLVSTFKQMIGTVQGCNTKLATGDFESALQGYEEALSMFEGMKNGRGIGICHNNIAITKMEMALRATDTSVRARDFGLAKEHFEMGITTARDIAQASAQAGDIAQASAAEPEGTSLLAAKLVIATRLCNLATCLNLERNLDAIRNTGVAAASEETELAAEVAPGSTKELDARCMLASLHTALGSPEAEQHWKEVDTMVAQARAHRQRSLQDPPPQSCLQQRALVSRAAAYADAGRVSEANELRAKALKVGPFADLRALTKAAKALADSDVRAMAKVGESALGQLQELTAVPKAVIFVLDYSGSMGLLPRDRYDCFGEWARIAGAQRTSVEQGQAATTVALYVRPDGAKVARGDFGSANVQRHPVTEPTWLCSTFTEGVTYSLDARPGMLSQLHAPLPPEGIPRAGDRKASKLREVETNNEGQMQFKCQASGMHYFHVIPPRGLGNDGVQMRITGGAAADARQPLRRIEASAESVLMVVRDHMRDNDQVAVTLFNDRVDSVLPWTTVRGREDAIESKLRESTHPSGDTALRDAVYQTVTRNAPDDKYWIVLLSDGEDNRSGTSQNTLLRKLRDAADGGNLEGLIAIAAGGEVDGETRAQLQAMADATQHGTLLAVGDADIAKAFDAAAAIMDGHIEPDAY